MRISIEDEKYTVELLNSWIGLLPHHITLSGNQKTITIRYADYNSVCKSIENYEISKNLGWFEDIVFYHPFPKFLYDAALE